MYPALAVAALVEAEEPGSVGYIGAPDSLEQTLASDAGLRFFPVRASGWDRARPWTLVTALVTAVASVFRCIRIVRRERADAVVGFGGYVSVPSALAAIALRVPLVLHEQNSVPGLANRLLSRWSRAVCVTYEASVPHLPRPDRAHLTGNPVRAAVLEGDGAAGRRAHGIADGETFVLAFGGSRGARHLNSALVGLYPRLSGIHGLRIVQIAGRSEAPAVRASLEAVAGTAPSWWAVLEYADDMGDLLAAADLVVCRAGATTLAELAAVAKPSVLVPYPYATDDHQTHNTEPFVRAGAAEMVPDAELDDPRFAETLLRLITDAQRRAEMARAAGQLGRPEAAAAVVDVVRQAAGRPTASGKGAR